MKLEVYDSAGQLKITGAGGGGGGGGVALSAAGGAITSGTGLFSNANGVSFGRAGQTITASHNGLTTAMASNAGSNFVAATAAFAGTNASGTIASNGISVSVAAPGAAAESNAIILLGANTLGNTTATGSTIGWSAGNGLTLSATNGSQVVLSVGPYITTAMSSNRASDFVAATAAFAGTNASGTVASNGVSVSVGNYITTARASTDAIGLNTAGTNVTWTVNSSGISINASGYAGIGTSATNASITLNSNGLAVSVAAPGGGAGVTYSGYAPFAGCSTAIQQHSNGTLMFFPVDLPAVQYDRVGFSIYNTNSSNSSGSHTLSFWYGLYTRNAGSLSLVHSSSGGTTLTHSGTAGSYSLFSGIRLFTIPDTTTLAAGNYWIGFVSRSTSGGANGSYSMACLSQVNSAVTGIFGAVATATFQPMLGLGVYSASTSGIPGSVAFTQITGTAANYRRFPEIFFASSTQ